MRIRSFLLSQLLIFVIATATQAQIPFFFDAGLMDAPIGTIQYDRNPWVDIANTTHDSIYQHEAYSPGTYTYHLKVKDMMPGETYSMYLHFAEIYYGPGNPGGGGTGSRIFDVDINGVNVLLNFDIFKTVGANTALVFRYDVLTKSDTTIALTFRSKTGDANLAAMELRPEGEASAYVPTSGVINLNGSFPVEWLGFEANVLMNNVVSLEWATASETNNLGFRVEMASDGQMFETLGFVQAGSVGGDSYTFETPSLASGRYTFRLAQVDMDGSVNYSTRIETRIHGDAWKGLIRNAGMQPVVSVEGLISSPVRATVYTINGQIAASREFTSAQDWTLDMNELPSGMYILTLTDGALSHTLKFSIQR